jgi:hypothetical protein
VSAVVVTWGASALVAPSAYAATTVAAWQMDETGGTTMIDSSGNGHNGQLHHVLVGVTSPTGRAYGFNGTNSVVTVPDAEDLDPGDTTFRVTATVRLDRKPRAPKDFDLVRKGVLATSNHYWKMQVNEAGRANCRFRGSSADVQVTDSRILSDGAWHQITCVRTTTSVGVEVDGRATTRNRSVGKIATGVPLSIGSKPAGTTDQLAGEIDSVVITHD